MQRDLDDTNSSSKRVPDFGKENGLQLAPSRTILEMAHGPLDTPTAPLEAPRCALCPLIMRRVGQFGCTCACM